jgi:hypothetical protein
MSQIMPERRSKLNNICRFSHQNDLYGRKMPLWRDAAATPVRPSSVYELKIVPPRWRHTLLDEGTMKVKRMGGMMTPTTGVRLDGPRHS